EEDGLSLKFFFSEWRAFGIYRGFFFSLFAHHQPLIPHIRAMKEYQDKNTHYNTSKMTFWQQQLNQSINYWQCQPVNLLGSFQLLNNFPLYWIEVLLKDFGFKDLAKLVEFIREQESTYLMAFRLPPDFDDTFVNLALGSLLHQQKDEFPVAWSQWRSHNPNITSVFDALKKYAYRPFSSDPTLNSIDPRTYFHIRGFLDIAQVNGQDVALVPTWIQNVDEERKEFYLGVAMPFGINNIDVTVSANTVYSITSGVLTGLLSPETLEDPVIEQIYHNTSMLIAYEIRNNFSGRPDLALTYYPSRMEFYWFFTRTVAVLETYRRNRTLPFEVMETVYKMFRDVAETHMTKNILDLAERDKAGRVYFDDFLGDGDVTFGGRPLNRAEDRIFTTSMAALALMSAWSYYDSFSRKSHWKQGTPRIVLETVAGCIKWLRQYSLSRDFKPWNAFFSGSTKSFETLPFWYPGNRLEYLNGTTISNWTDIPNSTFIYAVQEKHFGYPTPTEFHGYNNNSEMFPMWSSVSYTYSTTLLAVSKFNETVL
ncbi:unnamed protein product, partial [Candidula unifasciata]